mmetsp:Transcript_52711/g.71939  ORF Transcript_52711/g.71939 Transcript_52711/m.71939 type:complete len:102 (-) Transcript_52711:34-339(-)
MNETLKKESDRPPCILHAAEGEEDNADKSVSSRYCSECEGEMASPEWFNASVIVASSCFQCLLPFRSFRSIFQPMLTTTQQTLGGGRGRVSTNQGIHLCSV